NAHGRIARETRITGDPALPVQLLEIAVDAPLAERDAARRGEIGGNARALAHPLVQRGNARHLLLETFHPLWEGVAQTFNDLKQRKINIRELAAEKIRAAAPGQHALEIAQIFRHAVAPEVGGAALGGWALLLVIEVRRHWMMRVVDLDD